MGKKKTQSKNPAKKTESTQNGKDSRGNRGKNDHKRNGLVTAGADDYQFRRSVEGMPCMLLCRLRSRDANSHLQLRLQ